MEIEQKLKLLRRHYSSEKELAEERANDCAQHIQKLDKIVAKLEKKEQLSTFIPMSTLLKIKI